MKNFFNFKALVLSFVMAMLCVVPVSAQNSDDFFRVGDEYSGTRDAITYWTAANGIANNGIGQSEAPVGSGLLILTAVGAGYAISRRKRNFKNGATLLLAFALLLGMTQCKKNVETINPVGNGLHITLRVDGGSRANVTPGDEFATVTFEEGDVIYVGYNNACLGSLTYNAENQKFGGDVAFVTPVGDDSPLHFYFLGNKTPTITETTKYTVDIIDQTSKYPVISYNHSNEVYTGAGEYTANLFNYCSFMKFTTDNVTDINSQVLCITGMNNTVTVDFNGNNIEYGSIDNGLIKMPTSGSNVRWAIVLPQEELAAGSYGSVYTANGYYTSRPEMDEVLRNQYLKDPISIGEMDEGFDLSKGSFNNSEISNADIYQSNNGTATANTITIANGQKVFIHDVNIKAENTNAIVCQGNAEIVLCGTNTVTSESDPQTSGTLNFAVIKAGTYESTKTTLTISGDGILNAYPVYRSGATIPAHNGAVIGADYEGSCGNIVINSGTITVSTNYGAAIGSGRVSTGTSKCGSITIIGGTISATGSTGAGIGSGGRAWVSSNRGTTSCDGITINGGTVTARSVGGAAIGAGKCEGGGTNSDSYCGDILITGGTIDAQTTNTGDYAGAAIGGGYHSKAGNITISGGNVKAFGRRNSAGIGSGGCNSQCGNILINGGSVDAQGGYGNNYEGAGIGTGKGSANNAKSTCGTITITNGVTIVKAKNVTAVATSSTAKKSIGKGSLSYTQCGTVTINGKTGEIDGNVQYVYQPGAGS